MQYGSIGSRSYDMLGSEWWLGGNYEYDFECGIYRPERREATSTLIRYGNWGFHLDEAGCWYGYNRYDFGSTSSLVVSPISSWIIVPPIRAQIFTANGTWTAPATVTTAYFTGCAPGGGGGGYNNTPGKAGGGGGGGDAVIRKNVVVVPGTAYTVTCSATGGGGGALGNPANDGVNGANLTVGAILTLVGGNKGLKGAAAAAGFGGLGGGPGGFPGSDGEALGNNQLGMGGGNIFSGSPGLATLLNSNVAAIGYGIGGPGGNSILGNGVAGGGGYLLVEW